MQPFFVPEWTNIRNQAREMRSLERIKKKGVTGNILELHGHHASL